MTSCAKEDNNPGEEKVVPVDDGGKYTEKVVTINRNGEKTEKAVLRFYSNTDDLYPILFDYYIQCIDTLKTSDAVKELRSQYIEERGFVVHEPSVPEQPRISIVRFWVKLNRWLIPGMITM